MHQPEPPPAFRRAPHELWRGILETARSDAVAGVLLLLATGLALVVANSGAGDWYAALRQTRVGPASLHLDLSLAAWAADGLLAIFFFVVGLELKEELVHGQLRDPRKAALPIAAAVGGVVVPALVFVALARGGPEGALAGWAVPTATDIAFAIAVLAVVGRSLPPALRVFLLTLAIVDDLIAITIIALFYSDQIHLVPLLLALVPLALFAACVQRGVRAWWLLLPLAVVVWALVHASGVHATVAGVLLGFTVPVAATARARVEAGRDASGEMTYDGLAAHFADRWGLVATLVAVPVFAFFSAGVRIGGAEGLAAALRSPVTVGIVAGLVIGKPLGIVGTTWLMTRLRAFQLDPSLGWVELIGMSFVAGIGFTVSLLVGELAYGSVEAIPEEHTKVGVLLGSFLAAAVGAVVLGLRNRRAVRLGG